MQACFKGPAQRSTAPAGRLCSPPVPEDDTVTKLKERLEKFCLKYFQTTHILFCLLVLTVAAQFHLSIHGFRLHIHPPNFFFHSTQQRNFSEMLCECSVPPPLTLACQKPLFCQGLRNLQVTCFPAYQQGTCLSAVHNKSWVPLAPGCQGLPTACRRPSAHLDKAEQ